MQGRVCARAGWGVGWGRGGRGGPAQRSTTPIVHYPHKKDSGPKANMGQGQSCVPPPPPHTHTHGSLQEHVCSSAYGLIRTLGLPHTCRTCTNNGRLWLCHGGGGGELAWSRTGLMPQSELTPSPCPPPHALTCTNRQDRQACNFKLSRHPPPLLCCPTVDLVH